MHAGIVTTPPLAWHMVKRGKTWTGLVKHGLDSLVKHGLDSKGPD